MKIVSIVSARPNFMKTAPIVARSTRPWSVGHPLVHTGQHSSPRRPRSSSSTSGYPETGRASVRGRRNARGANGGRSLVGVERDLLAVRAASCFVVVGDVNEHRWRFSALAGGEARSACGARRGRACGRATGRCPRKSTGSSPTASPICSSRRLARRRREPSSRGRKPGSHLPCG